MVKTPHFHCKVHGFDPWSGTKSPHTLQCSQDKNKTKVKKMVVMAVVVKNLPANAGNVSDMDLIPRSRRYLGGRTHFCILAWRLPRTEESEGLQFIGLQRVGHH